MIDSNVDLNLTSNKDQQNEVIPVDSEEGTIVILYTPLGDVESQEKIHKSA